MVRLECKICLREYKSNVSNLTPRILTACGHTICEDCVGVLIERHPAGNVSCPFDRTVTNINGDVEELHKNFAIIEYIEEVEQGDPPVAVQIRPEPPVDIAENNNGGRLPIVNRAEDFPEEHNDVDLVVRNGLRVEENIPFLELLGWFDPLPEFLLDEDFVEEDEESEYSDSDDEGRQLFADMVNVMDNFNIGDFEENYEDFNDEYV